MNEVQLLYVENVISRKKKRLCQNVSFYIVLENISHDKQCEVVWAGEDGHWQTLSASYHSNLEPNKEYWTAHVSCVGSSVKSLPGNIVFALRYQTLGCEYWDNNEGLNYSSQADSGVKVLTTEVIQNIGFESQLLDDQNQISVVVSVKQALQVSAVTLHWSTDNWRHTNKTSCHFNRHYWDEATASNARNPNQYGSEIWQGKIKLDSAFSVQYLICCETAEQTYWDNNKGNNYSLRHKPLSILMLNLHCYQEDNQRFKFSQIAKAINEQNADIICLQEVAELWNNGQGDWSTNAAKIINDQLPQPFHLYTDWSHLGFDKYREGVAILSRYPILHQASKFVSNSHSPDNIHTRRVVMAQVNVPFLGLFNIYSVHLSWWDDGFSEQFTRLSQWASDNQTNEVKGTLLCGDFNITVGSEGYDLVVNNNNYEDPFLTFNSQGTASKIFKVNDPYWQHSIAEDYRIDYLFMKKDSQLKIIAANILFTDEDYGRVSDHCGYLMTFEAG